MAFPALVRLLPKNAVEEAYAPSSITVTPASSRNRAPTDTLPLGSIDNLFLSATPSYILNELAKSPGDADPPLINAQKYPASLAKLKITPLSSVPPVIPIPPYAVPVTSTVRAALGVDVPIPTFPFLSTIRLVFVELPTTNAGSPPIELTESFANGAEVARPSLPVKLFVFENVLKSERRVEEAAVPNEVSIQTRPVDVVLSVPTVVVESVRKRVYRFVDEAFRNDEYIVEEE